MRKIIFSFLSLVALGTVAAWQTPSQMSNQDTALIIEGMLTGIIRHEKFTDLDTCVVQSSALETTLAKAFDDFQRGDFEGIRSGLEEIGRATKMIPEIVRECKIAEGDLERLEKAAEIFLHPYKLSIVMSKNLVVNGIDIFKQITGSRAAYSIHEMFDCGFHVGFAFDELFLSQANQELKSTTDLSAYKALQGLLEEAGVAGDYEKLYNKIDHRGILIWGPIQQVMTNLQYGDLSNYRLWMSLHEVGHIFRESGDLLITEGVLTRPQLDQLRGVSDALDQSIVDHEKLAADLHIQDLLLRAYRAYLSEDEEEMVGRTLGQLAQRAKNIPAEQASSLKAQETSLVEVIEKSNSVVPSLDDDDFLN